MLLPVVRQAQCDEREARQSRKGKDRRLRHGREFDVIDPHGQRAIDVLGRSAVELPGDGPDSIIGRHQGRRTDMTPPISAANIVTELLNVIVIIGIADREREEAVVSKCVLGRTGINFEIHL